MTKKEFTGSLRAELAGIPQSDLEERLNFYSEMIDDRIEEGLSEEEAVDGLGSVQDIASQIKADIPLLHFVKEKVKPNRTLTSLEIVLLVLGSPIWISLLASITVAFLTVYIVFWSLIVALWAIEAALVACPVAGFVYSVYSFITGSTAIGLALLGGTLACAGLAILAACCFSKATKGIIWLTSTVFSGIKSLFIKKEASK